MQVIIVFIFSSIFAFFQDAHVFSQTPAHLPIFLQLFLSYVVWRMFFTQYTCMPFLAVHCVQTFLPLLPTSPYQPTLQPLILKKGSV